MKKAPQFKIVLFLFLIISLGLLFFVKAPVYSQSITDLEKQIEENAKQIALKEGALGSIEKRIADIKGSNASLSQKIQLMTEEINNVKKILEDKEAEIEVKGKEIEGKQIQLQQRKETLDLVSAELYMETRNRVSTFFLSNWSDLMRNYYVRRNIITDLRLQVEMISGEFSSLAEAKEKLDLERTDLDTQKKGLDDSLAMLATEKAKLQAELNIENAKKSSIKAQIGNLTKEISATQQMLLYLKGGGDLSGTNVPSSRAEPTTQLAYFNANAPSGTFGIFSFGGGTHRNGMSQWGAWERAQVGQSYLDILGFYYQTRNIQTNLVKTVAYGTEQLTSDIQVSGYVKRINLEEYVLGVREIDPLFNKDTPQDLNNLKAQAIASRTYAVNYTNNGRKAICTTQSCQVYSSTEQHGGAWAKAVAETKGMTLANSLGNIFSAQFSAVTGGYINGVGYDLNTSLQGPWTEKAWEGLSGVSWFHKIWYQRTITEGSVTRKITCPTHPNPWMTGEELADILNAYKYFTAPGTPSFDPRLTAIDINTCFNKSDNPYSFVELANLVENPISKVLKAEAINSNGWTVRLNFDVQLKSGVITTYTINGSTSPSGATAVFREVFNMRAPGYLSIPQKCSSCPGFIHINIVKK